MKTVEAHKLYEYSLTCQRCGGVRKKKCFGAKEPMQQLDCITCQTKTWHNVRLLDEPSKIIPLNLKHRHD